MKIPSSIEEWTQETWKPMIEKPIIFSTEMVRAILDGRKSQTRRIVKPQPAFSAGLFGIDNNDGYLYDLKNFIKSYSRYQKSDHLWVRETWCYAPDLKPSECYYKADGYSFKIKWKPSIFMPKKYARIWLEVLDVRVERLRNISGKDSVAEGCGEQYYLAELLHYGGYKKARLEFKDLWNSINGKKYPWDSNPWVWVIEFKRLVD